MSGYIKKIENHLNMSFIEGYSGGTCGNIYENYDPISQQKPKLLNSTDKVYQIFIKHNGQEIFNKNFQTQELFEQFVMANVQPRIINPLLTTLIPFYIDTIGQALQSLLIPTTIRQMTRKNNHSPLILKCFSIIAAFVLDSATLPIRFFTIWASRYVYTQEVTPLTTKIKEDHPNLKLDTYLEVHLIAWKVFDRNEKPWEEKLSKIEIAYNLFSDPINGFFHSDSYFFSTEMSKSYKWDRSFNLPTTQTADLKKSQALKVMGLSQNYTKEELTKAFKKLSLEGEYRHPDKGGSTTLFQQLADYREYLLTALG